MEFHLLEDARHRRRIRNGVVGIVALLSLTFLISWSSAFSRTVLIVLGVIIFGGVAVLKSADTLPKLLPAFIAFAVTIFIGGNFLRYRFPGQSEARYDNQEGAMVSVTPKENEQLKRDLKLPPTTFSVLAERNTNGEARIKGTTNLPDDTILMVSLNNEDLNYVAQDETRVVKGEFSTGFFSDHGSALRSGAYRVRITVPISEVQSKTVQEWFGPQGENLSGPFAKESETFANSKIIEFSEELSLSTPGPNASANPDVRENSITDTPPQTNSPLGGASTGYDWKKASVPSRTDYCAVMARRLQYKAPKATGGYLYDALSAFYNSDDPNILRQKTADIAELCAMMADSAD